MKKTLLSLALALVSFNALARIDINDGGVYASESVPREGLNISTSYTLDVNGQIENYMFGVHWFGFDVYGSQSWYAGTVVLPARVNGGIINYTTVTSLLYRPSPDTLGDIAGAVTFSETSTEGTFSVNLNVCPEVDFSPLPPGCVRQFDLTRIAY